MDDPLPGFRFYPTEEELVSFYLHHKLRRTQPNIDRVIPVVDIYDYNPWDLPEFAGDLCRQDNEQWFFFIPRQEREARGGRPNRLTTEGYWKATGTPGEVYSSRDNTVIGRKRTMVYYMGRAPNGTKTVWKMNEYKAVKSSDETSSSSSSIPPNPQVTEGLSLCRLYKRSRTLRAFDRRPISDAPSPANFQYHGDNTGGTAAAVAAAPNDQYYYDYPMAPTNQVTDRGSVDSSSPGRHAGAAYVNPLPEDETPPENESWWDSDNFNWFDI